MAQERKELRLKKLAHYKGDLPRYESAGASGFDIRAQLEQPIVVERFQRMLVPTGLAMEIPRGFEIQVRARSGLAIKNGIAMVNAPGTIDADYRGEIKVILINLGSEPFEIKDQDRIAQFVLCPVYQASFVEVQSLESSARGEGGFGSTGV